MLQYVVFVGAAVQLIGIFDYLKETIKGNTQPNKVSWLLWSVGPIIAAVAAFADGVRLSAVPVLASACALPIFIVSFFNKKSYWKLEKFDYFCGVCSFLAIIFWVITKEPIVAIVFAILADVFAGIPTIIKSWQHPESETASPYAAGLFSACTSFFAIKLGGFSEFAFPIYLITINSILVIAIARKKFIKRVA